MTNQSAPVRYYPSEPWPVCATMSLTHRSAKSGNDWTSNELDAYKIVIRNQSARSFFGQDLPATLEGVDPGFMSATNPNEVVNANTHRLLMYLGLATRANAGQESTIDDFAKELLRMLGFEERNCVLRSRYAIPLHICGEPTRKARTDICLVHCASTVLLVVQEDKTELSAKDPEPQIVAEAVAAFQMNNRNRSRLGLDKMARMSIPCITMVGTRPIFYVVPVTQQLSTAIERGEYPEHVTEVRKCVVGERRRLSEGMERPDFRVEALKHYILFRTLSKSLWSEFLAE